MTGDWSYDDGSTSTGTWWFEGDSSWIGTWATDESNDTIKYDSTDYGDYEDYTCTDLDDGTVTNSYGETCAYYSQDGYEAECPYMDTDTFVASDLCCACGGGHTTTCTLSAGMLTSTFATDYPWMQWTESLNSLASAQIRVDPSMLEATCVDGDSGEVDSNTGASSNDGSGNTCAYYSLSGNSGDCGSFDDGDFVAATLCCACGGGTTTNAHVNDASILAPYLGSP